MNVETFNWTGRWLAEQIVLFLGTNSRNTFNRFFNTFISFMGYIKLKSSNTYSLFVFVYVTIYYSLWGQDLELFLELVVPLHGPIDPLNRSWDRNPLNGPSYLLKKVQKRRNFDAKGGQVLLTYAVNPTNYTNKFNRETANSFSHAGMLTFHVRPKKLGLFICYLTQWRRELKIAHVAEDMGKANHISIHHSKYRCNFNLNLMQIQSTQHYRKLFIWIEFIHSVFRFVIAISDELSRIYDIIGLVNWE